MEDNPRLIIESIRTNSTPRHLDLSRVTFSPSEWMECFMALLSNTSVRILNVSDQKIGDGLCSLLSDALALNSSIRVLIIGCSGFSHIGFSRLEEAIEKNTNLISIALIDSKISTYSDFPQMLSDKPFMSAYSASNERRDLIKPFYDRISLMIKRNRKAEKIHGKCVLRRMRNIPGELERLVLDFVNFDLYY